MAALVAVAAVRRSFFPQPAAASSDAAPPQFVQQWQELVTVGIPAAGPDTAPVTIVEFMDLECPAWRRFQRVVDAFASTHPEVRVVHVAFPLSYHRFALGAAQAGVCAASIGAYPDWMSTVFAKQDSLGLKSWGSYALEAGIPDTALIAECARNSEPAPAIEAGLRWGRQLGLDRVPMVLVNGWRYSHTPTVEELEGALEAARGDTLPQHRAGGSGAAGQRQ